MTAVVARTAGRCSEDAEAGRRGAALEASLHFHFTLFIIFFHTHHPYHLAVAQPACSLSRGRVVLFAKATGLYARSGAPWVLLPGLAWCGEQPFKRLLDTDHHFVDVASFDVQAIAVAGRSWSPSLLRTSDIPFYQTPCTSSRALAGMPGRPQFIN